MKKCGAFVLLVGTAHSLSVPHHGTGRRTLCVDFGLRRCGIAVSSGYAPVPLGVVSCRGAAPEELEATSQAVARIASGELAQQLVVGMPYTVRDGIRCEGEQAALTREFAAHLANASPSPVFLWDESFSSAEAQTRMNGGRGASAGEQVDAVAAALILEDWFDEPRGRQRADAPHVPPTRAPTPTPTPPRPAAVPHSEARRAMMERAAEQQQEAPVGRGRRQRRGRRR